jgi:hypothetical protein
MPLMIQFMGRVAAPKIVCDHCHQLIEDATDGNYHWSHAQGGEPGQLAAVYFTHKACCHPFEAARPEGQWGAIELEWLVAFLAENLHVDVKRTKAVIRKFNC